jgi:gas vesicle protein
MAKSSKHTTAFVMGTLLGGAAAAAAAIWNSPQSGKRTRQQLTAKVENTIFDLLGTNESQLGRRLTPEAPAPAMTEGNQPA